jgi:hypothetical protein
MNLRAPTRTIRAALALNAALALAACAGVDVKPDKPFKTANVCAAVAIPAGWIRTNDWRGKGCGIDETAGTAARERRAGIQLVSATLAPKVKASAKPPADLSRGVNAVAENGPNNWMSIAALDRVRVGRSLTACAGAVPAGWIEKSRYWDKGRCGNPLRPSEKNVMLIERVK